MDKRRGRETHPQRRIAAIAVFMAVVVLLYSIRLYQIQVGDPETYLSGAGGSGQIELPIAPTRGEILDRQMNALVVNKTTYAIVLDAFYWPSGSSDTARAAQNTALLHLCGLLTAAEEEWNDRLPITKTSPYSFEEGRESAVSALKESLRLAPYATVENCLAALAETYGLTGYEPAVQRQLAGIHYSMAQADFSTSNPYTFAPSVSKKTSYTVSEALASLPGVNVTLVPERSYVNGDLASHLLGTVGLLSPEEYADLKDDGYSYSDSIGKFGIEQAMEAALRGSAGVRTIYKNGDGDILSEAVTTDPQPGQTVVLTLDSDLQRLAQTTMDSIVKEFRSLPKGSDGKDIGSGGVVMLDIATGGTLVAASWPNFNLGNYYDDYSELLSHPDQPLYNRALDGAFAPGSTFKVSVAIAALNESLLTATQTLFCGGAYTYYSDSGLTIRCMGYHGHHNVVTALGKSCNAFFCEAGRLTGINTMNKYARDLGLGVRTGIEVGESAGVLAGPDERVAAGGTWFPADTSQAALGQSDNLFTPMQLAAYAMTVANRGIRYQTHLVRATVDHTGKVTETSPTVAADMSYVRPDVWDTIEEGMILTYTNGTATRFFYGADYDIAAKTGTAEAGNGGSDHGVFIGYGPVGNPQVAIAVVMENGTSAAACRTARAMLDAWFAEKQTDDMPNGGDFIG